MVLYQLCIDVIAGRVVNHHYLYPLGQNLGEGFESLNATCVIITVLEQRGVAKSSVKLHARTGTRRSDHRPTCEMVVI